MFILVSYCTVLIFAVLSILNSKTTNNLRKKDFKLPQQTCKVIVMKFLIIQKVKREVPLDRWAKLLPLQFKYFERLEKEKTIETSYHLIGQQGSMLIINADSDEKLSKIVGQDPLFFELDRQIYPLTTRETHYKQILEMLKGVAR